MHVYVYVYTHIHIYIYIYIWPSPSELTVPDVLKERAFFKPPPRTHTNDTKQ